MTGKIATFIKTIDVKSDEIYKKISIKCFMKKFNKFFNEDLIDENFI